jgi:hypothetical protein
VKKVAQALGAPVQDAKLIKQAFDVVDARLLIDEITSQRSELALRASFRFVLPRSDPRSSSCETDVSQTG